MNVLVHVKATNEPIIFTDAKASTNDRGRPADDLYVYRDDERIAHFVGGEWAYWSSS